MPVYFDHNATTPLAPEVLEAMMPYMSSIYGNPSSVHRYGRLARNALEEARQQVANLLGAQPNQVVFTSGGTEANNLALKGSLQAHKPARFALSGIEHAAMLDPARQLEQAGWQLDMIPVNSQGVVTEAALQEVLTPQTELVSVMAANNETGVLQNLPALVSQARSVNEDLLFHSDACQIAGKLPVNFAELGLDMLTLSAHKLYGPQGAGALIVSRRIDLQPQISGGGQESGRRSGTENLAAIVGFGQAAELAVERQQQREQQTLALRRQLQQALIDQPGVTVFSAEVERLPNTLQFSVAGIDGETLLMQLDKKGFAVSSGSACQSGKTDPSHVLLAMQVEPAVAKGSIRVSFGEQNTQAQVTQFIEALAQIRQQFN
jgi:cysteine desulfurase